MLLVSNHKVRSISIDWVLCVVSFLTSVTRKGSFASAVLLLLVETITGDGMSFGFLTQM